jgi:2-(1,2-epoxy-1,2-dihydrophenyl)acetyl-CoA isomerase
MARSLVFPAFRPIGTQGLEVESFNRDALAGHGALSHAQPLLDQGPAGLPVVYTMDAGGFDIVVNGDHLLSWGVEPADVQDAALRNLAAWSAGAAWVVEESGARRLVSSQTGEGWDAVRIILPESLVRCPPSSAVTDDPGRAPERHRSPPDRRAPATTSSPPCSPISCRAVGWRDEPIDAACSSSSTVGSSSSAGLTPPVDGRSGDGPRTLRSAPRDRRRDCYDHARPARCAECIDGGDDGNRSGIPFDCQGSFRAVILTGAGRAFCAGQDLRERLEPDAAPLAVEVRERYNPIIRQMRSLDQPIVGAINGVAAGAGASLAFACDLRVAAENASFLLAFGRIGLVPDSGATWLLPRLVGPAKAAELALLGDSFSAADAERFGLVARVVPAGSLEETARDMATRLASLAPQALALTKRALQRSWSVDLDEALEDEAFRQGIAGATADHAEGLAAFLDKRPPRFTGE